jgi:sterol desaturase/sphingolipid hydroxylase (fatty acid hydroxylase superfamily)
MCTVGGIVLLYYFAYEGFHYLMHKPSLPWIERRGFFKFIERHHKLHHVYMGKNFNVVLPLADLLLGTLVLTDPLPAKVTEPAARQVARRHSKWGQRLREEAEARAHQSAGSLPDNVAVPPEH